MAQLQSTNVVGNLTVNGVAVGGGKDFKFCCFTGSSTWTPTSDFADSDQFVESHVLGAGGGGGGMYQLYRSAYRPECGCICNLCCSGDGGQGSYRIENIQITSTDACTVTVGAGGTGGTIAGACTNTPDPGTFGCGCSEWFQYVTQSILDANDIQPGAVGGNSSFGNVLAGGGSSGYTCIRMCLLGTNCRGESHNQANFNCCVAGLAGTDYPGNQDLNLNWYTSASNSTFYGTSLESGSAQSAYGCNPSGYPGVDPNVLCAAYRMCGPYSNCKKCYPLSCMSSASQAAGCTTDACDYAFTPATAGAGICQCTCLCRDQVNRWCTAYSRGSDGNDGIVVLRWYE